MADHLRKLEAGEKLRRIPRQTFNALVDLAERDRGKRHDRAVDTSVTQRQSTIVLVKNASEADRDRFDVLGIDGPIYGPADNLDQFKNQVALVGVVPQEAEHYGKFVILLEPIAEGAIGRGYLAGVTPVQLNVRDPQHAYADITPGDATRLTTCQTGAAHILWKESSGWALVRLGNPAPRVYALEDCAGKHPTIFVVNNLADHVEGVVEIEERPGVCFRVRIACDADHCYAPICVTIKHTYRACETCHACWELTKCDDSYSLVTSTDLAPWENGGVELSDADTDNHAGCYRVSLAENCYDARPVTPLNYYTGSDFCAEKCGKCYTLVRCHGPSEETLEVADDLAGLIGKTPAEIVSQQTVWLIQGKCWQAYSYGECVSAPVRYGVKAEDYYPSGCPSCSETRCVALVRCDDDEIHRCVGSATREIDGEPINLAERIGEACLLDDGHFYAIRPLDEVDPPCACEPGESVVVREIFDDCDSIESWQLVLCNDEETTLDAYNDFAGDGYSINEVVKLADPDAGCWRLNLRVDYVHGTTKRVTIVSGPHPNCEVCQQTIKYRLTHDCQLEECDEEQSLPDIITTADLHDSVGRWRKVEGHVYLVVVTETGDVTDPDLVSQGPFDTCEAALAAPIDGKIPPLAGYRVEGSQFILEMNSLVLRGGVIAGVCFEDFVVQGTVCGGSSA